MPKIAVIEKPMKLPGAKASGRVFSISMKGIPKVDAKTKARLEAAARNPDGEKRYYPILAVKA